MKQIFPFSHILYTKLYSFVLSVLLAYCLFNAIYTFIIGGTGFVIALLLAIALLGISTSAALLLLPYLLWSPIGTYTTWEMGRLNPQDV